MSTITLPSAFKPHSFRMPLPVSQRVTAAPFGGSEQAVDMLNDRWICHIDTASLSDADGAILEAFIASMRGQTNTVALCHYNRKLPSGTIRGTLTLNAAAAQGASSIVITGCSPSNGTFLAGDMLGVGGLLLMAANDCAAVSGVVTVNIVNRLRAAQSIGAAVTWSQPTALFRMLATSGVNYTPDGADPISFDFGEAI